MSAWIVSKAHIDRIVGAAMYGVSDYEISRKYGLGELLEDRLSDLGDNLWAENFASVNYRYRENDTPPPYTFERRSMNTRVEILNAIGCYCYQTCEHPEWEDSYAYHFMQMMRKSLGLGEDDDYHDLPGCDAAPWGFDN